MGIDSCYWLMSVITSFNSRGVRSDLLKHKYTWGRGTLVVFLDVFWHPKSIQFCFFFNLGGNPEKKRWIFLENEDQGNSWGEGCFPSIYTPPPPLFLQAGPLKRSGKQLRYWETAPCRSDFLPPPFFWHSFSLEASLKELQKRSGKERRGGNCRWAVFRVFGAPGGSLFLSIFSSSKLHLESFTFFLRSGLC